MRRLPFLKLLAILQILLLARHHLQGLSRADRRRMTELVRRGHRLSKAERRELRELAMKLEPGTFARGAAARLSPVGFPRKRG
jgi:triphosphoribosyl-dephospho-CoA synthetase